MFKSEYCIILLNKEATFFTSLALINHLKMYNVCQNSISLCKVFRET